MIEYKPNSLFSQSTKIFGEKFHSLIQLQKRKYSAHFEDFQSFIDTGKVTFCLTIGQFKMLHLPYP